VELLKLKDQIEAKKWDEGPNCMLALFYYGGCQFL